MLIDIDEARAMEKARETGWKPTHVVTFSPAYYGDNQTWLVMLDEDETGGGPAYTAGEWNAEGGSKWRYAPIGMAESGWFFNGRVTPNGQAGHLRAERIDGQED